MWLAASRRKLRLTIFLPLKVNGIGSDEIDGETPSMARETRALPKTYCIVPDKILDLQSVRVSSQRTEPRGRPGEEFADEPIRYRLSQKVLPPLSGIEIF